MLNEETIVLRTEMKRLQRDVRELAKEQTKTTEELKSVAVAIASLKTKSSVWGAVAGGVISLVAFLASILAGCAPLPVANPGGIIPLSTLDKVVALVRDDGSAYCSGSITQYGVLTAYHCVVGHEDDVYIGHHRDAHRGYFNTRYHTTVRRVDSDHDLALLHYRATNYFQIAHTSPLMGEVVTAIGHPLGIPFVAHRGTVSTDVRTRERPPLAWYGVDAGLIGGMSGGPVLNNAGDIVGVVSFTWGYSHLGGVLPAESIQQFIAGL